MPDQVSYSYARRHLARILRDAEERQEPIIISRRGRPDMALLPADELRSLEETAHLLRSPRNARRLLQALQRALDGGGSPETAETLRSDPGV